MLRNVLENTPRQMQYWREKESERESSSRHRVQQRELFLPHASVRFASLCYIMSSWTANFRAKYPLTACQKYPPRDA